MGDPGAVVAVAGLAFRVGAHLGEGGLVGGGIALHGDLRSHAAHGEGAPAVAGLDQLQRIGGQEGRAHAHHRAVRRQGFRVGLHPLDVGEDVVPAAAVQAGHVVAQFVEDLVHLEGGRQGLDQHRRLDRSVRDVERGLGVGEDVGPEARLQMALHLRQVEVGAGAGVDLRLGVVEEVEAEVEQRPGHLLAVDRGVGLRQVPSARPDDQGRDLVLQRIGLARGRVGEAQLARPAVLQVRLAFQHVGPSRRGGVLEVGHEHLRARVQGVDDHLAVDWPGDLDAAVEQVVGDRRHRPVAGAHARGFRQEVGGLPGVEAGLADLAGLQKLQAARIEPAVQLGDERQRVRRQHLGGAALHRTLQLDVRTAGEIDGHRKAPAAGGCSDLKMAPRRTRRQGGEPK